MNWSRTVGGASADVPPTGFLARLRRKGPQVSALKISWRRASLEAGFEAGFIQDIITGRSQRLGEDALVSLATVLMCCQAKAMTLPEHQLLKVLRYRLRTRHSGRMR
jgi:hypothetical protein